MSQAGYPKEIVLDNTPLIAFTYNQVREINVALEEGEGCKVVLDSTEKLVMTQEGLILTGKQLIENMKAQISGYESLVTYQDKSIKLLQDKNNKLEKSKKVNKTVGGIIIGILATAVTTLGIYIGTH